MWCPYERGYLGSTPGSGIVRSVDIQMFDFMRKCLIVLPHSLSKYAAASIIAPHYSLLAYKRIDDKPQLLPVASIALLSMAYTSLPRDLHWPMEHDKKWQVPYLSRNFKGHHKVQPLLLDGSCSVTLDPRVKIREAEQQPPEGTKVLGRNKPSL